MTLNQSVKTVDSGRGLWLQLALWFLQCMWFDSNSLSVWSLVNSI